MPNFPRSSKELTINKFLLVFLIELVAGHLIVPLSWAENIREVYEKGDAAFAQGHYKEAITYFEQVTKMNPKFAPGFNALGLAMKADSADLAEVAWYFKTAIELDPQYSEAYDNLGKAYYGLGYFDKAEQYCLKSLSLDPKNVSAQLSLAWIYLLGKSDTNKAIEYFQDVLKKVKIANVYYGMGMAYFMNDDRAMVLDMITQLRGMGENELAIQLEDMIRGKRYVPGSEGQRGSLVDIEPREIPEDVQVPPGENFVPLGQGSQSLDSMMRVRLRGRLFNVESPEEKSSSEEKKKNSSGQIIGTQSQSQPSGIQSTGY